MEKRLNELFKKNTTKAPAALSQDIWEAVLFSRKARYKYRVYVGIGILSLSGLVPALQMLIREVTASGFFQYASLLFTSKILLSSGKELLLAIVEATPVMSIVLCLLLIILLVNSLFIIVKRKRVFAF